MGFRTNLILALGLVLVAAGTIAATGGAPGPQAACRAPDHSEGHVPGGTFQMGSAEYYEEEGPVHSETVAPFWIDRYDVTNADFAKFVAATDYVMHAEKKRTQAHS